MTPGQPVAAIPVAGPDYIRASSVPTLSAATYVPGTITTTGFRPRLTVTR